MIFQFLLRTPYGTKRFYPLNKAAEIICDMKKQTTLTNVDFKKVELLALQGAKLEVFGEIEPIDLDNFPPREKMKLLQIW